MSDTKPTGSLRSKEQRLADLRYEHAMVHGSYWFMIDSGHYSGREDHRARSHWQTVAKLEDKIEKLKAELG
jgi:hypothetical protein